MLFSVVITGIFIILGLIKRNSKFVTICLLVLLYILFAFEKSEGDYRAYVNMYQQIGSGSGYAMTYEVIYVWLSKIGNNLRLSFEGLRGIICLFEVYFLYHTIKKHTPNTAMVLALFFLFPAMIDAELFRFLLGMCIMIFGLQFLLKGGGVKNYLAYFVMHIIASLIHSSFWICVIFYLLVIRNTKKLLRIVLISLVVGIAAAKTDLFFYVLKQLPIRTFIIEKYQTGNYANSMGMLVAFVKQVLIFSMALVANKIVFIENGKLVFRRNQLLINPSQLNWKAKEVNYFEALENRILGINYVAFLLLIPLYYSSSVHRLTHIVVFFNYIALAHRMYTEKNKFYVLYAFIVSIILFIVLLFIESSGTVYSLTSHFTEGYFVNLSETLLK